MTEVWEEPDDKFQEMFSYFIYQVDKASSHNLFFSRHWVFVLGATGAAQDAFSDLFRWSININTEGRRAVGGSRDIEGGKALPPWAPDFIPYWKCRAGGVQCERLIIKDLLIITGYFLLGKCPGYLRKTQSTSVSTSFTVYITWSLYVVCTRNHNPGNNGWDSQPRLNYNSFSLSPCRFM